VGLLFDCTCLQASTCFSSDAFLVEFQSGFIAYNIVRFVNDKLSGNVFMRNVCVINFSYYYYYYFKIYKSLLLL